jgi:hypothetical protein
MHRPRTIDEQPHGVGRRQRRDAPYGLAGHVERLPTGSQDGDAVARAQHGVDDTSARLDQVLAVVEH